MAKVNYDNFKEENYEAQIQAVADAALRDMNKRFIFVAGGSCTGKTPTAVKLADAIRKGGRQADVISTDDFYRNEEEAVYLPDGTKDIETINSLRLDILQDVLHHLAKYEKTSLPFYDFKVHRRFDNHHSMQMTDSSVTILEGLHALNPIICPPGVPREACLKVFLYVNAGDGADDRFVRRVVRDSRRRDSNAEIVYAQWDTVLAAEQESIMQFVPDSDYQINTFLDYERNIFADDAIAVLEKLPKDNPHQKDAKKLIKILSKIELLPDSRIPEKSLLWEFV